MMKRFAVYFCILLMLVSHVAMAENDSSAYIGNMEVVNCNEWVSLREKPSTSAARLVTVSLGAIVHSCSATSTAASVPIRLAPVKYPTMTPVRQLTGRNTANKRKESTVFGFPIHFSERKGANVYRNNATAELHRML